MKQDERFSQKTLLRLLESTSPITLDRKTKLVLFSDLHLGNGGKTDDFLHNSDLFQQVLKEHYYEHGYTLILNGDIEELQRFALRDILERWDSVYDLFGLFESESRLFRLVGNHDMDLLHVDHGFTVGHALRYDYRGDTIFVFHGHQTTLLFEKFNWLVGFGLRYFAEPLRITGYGVPYNNLKRFRAEERVYRFASKQEIIAIIGHTHRPLFESMSKIDNLKFEIERLCRAYPHASTENQIAIAQIIHNHTAELRKIESNDNGRAAIASLYDASLLIPCTFNSGTVIGKRGMTCIEIKEGEISLVHWFDEARSRKYLEYADYETEKLPGTAYHQVVIKSDNLDYIFSRIKLLSGV